MRQKLEIAANVAVIVIAVAVCAVIVRQYVLKPQPTSVGVKAGDHLGTVPIDWGKYNRTLVLAMRVGCEFCEKSAPFYRRLLDLERKGEINAHIVAAFPDDSQSTRTFLASEGMAKIDAVSGVSPSSLRVAGTPTAILVSNAGRVLKVWLGLLSQQGQENLTTAIEAKPVAMSR
jgi:hypothetical protein